MLPSLKGIFNLHVSNVTSFGNSHSTNPIEFSSPSKYGWGTSNKCNPVSSTGMCHFHMLPATLVSVVSCYPMRKWLVGCDISDRLLLVSCKEVVCQHTSPDCYYHTT